MAITKQLNVLQQAKVCEDDPMFTNIPLIIFIVLYSLLVLAIITMFYLHTRETRERSNT